MTTTEREIFAQQKTLIESIESLCCLIKNKAKQRVEKEGEKKVIRNKKLVDVARNVEEASIEAARWMFALREKRSDLKQFQRNVEIDKKAAELAKKSIEENSKKVLTTETAKFSSAMSAVNLETDTRKKCIETEMQLFDFRFKSVNEIRWWEKNDLRNARYKARKRCLDQLVKYDDVIGALYANKITLLTEKDFVEKEYTITQQDQLIEQRSLYKRLKEEYKLKRREAFLTELKHFRRNRAAKIIQRQWRIYYARMSSKKKRKNRK